MSSPRLTVLGLDASTLDVIRPMIAAGELPNLASLLGEGASGVLRSTTHPLTPHAWTTMVTGVNVGRHGIWDFTERDETGYRLRVANGSFRRAPALWDRLTRSGRRCGLVNIPFTWPAPEVDGFAIAGFDAAAREAGWTSPATLVGELRSRFGSLELDNRFPLAEDGAVDLAQVKAAAVQKVETVRWLTERYDPELLFVVFMAADHVQHLCWDAWERDGVSSPVAETYRILDDAVGELVELAAGNDVLVVSDHGAGALEGVVNLNAWLAGLGHLEFAGASADVARRTADRLFALRRIVPPRVRYALKQRLPGLREKAYTSTDWSAIDWARTKAFSYGTFGNIVVNVRGRETSGIVEPGAEYEQVRDEIAAAALELRAPDGRAVVTAVHRREDLFEGPELERVPDLLIEFTDYRWLGKGNLKSSSTELWDRIEIEPGSSHSYVGSHRHEGIVALAGPSAAADVELEASILDVAPTILYLLGEKIPASLEGRVLFEAISPDVLDTRPPEYDDEPDDDPVLTERQSLGDQAEVEERLRGLGYLE
ncbi:MAG: alkaline phosphatase family protein [Gaiellales bacterium]